MIFEALAYEDNEGKDNLRKATVLANTRLRNRYSRFISSAVSESDRQARISLVQDSLKSTVAEACEEFGVDPAQVESTVISHFLAGAEHLKEFQFKKKEAEPEEDPADSFDNELEGKEANSYGDPLADEYGGGGGNMNAPYDQHGIPDPHSCDLCYDEATTGRPCPYHMGMGADAHGMNATGVHPQQPQQGQLFGSRQSWNDGGYEDEPYPSGPPNMDPEAYGPNHMQSPLMGGRDCANCGSELDPNSPACQMCGAAHGMSARGPHDPIENDFYYRGPDKFQGNNTENDLEGYHRGKIARRPKMCPYHRELVDSSLHAGEPQYAAFAGAVGGAGHCAGGFDGTCNFKPGMVAQQYWDDRQKTLDEARQQTELDNQTFTDTPIPEALPEETMADNAGEGVTDINTELEHAPSAVGQGDLAMAASTRLADGANQNSQVGDWTNRESLPDHKNDSSTGLSDQPSPKMDKTKWKPNALYDNGNLKPIETDKGTKWPTVKQDVTSGPDYKSQQDDKGWRDQTDSVAEHDVDVTQGSEGTPKPAPVDSPYQWTDKSTQADPVTSIALSSVDPDKNPIRELLSNGFVPETQVDKLISDYNE